MPSPGTLSVEEWVQWGFPGRLPGLRVSARPPAFPVRVAGPVAAPRASEDLTHRSQWRDRGRISRPFLFPDQIGTPREPQLSKTGQRRSKIASRDFACQAPRPAGCWSISSSLAAVSERRTCLPTTCGAQRAPLEQTALPPAGPRGCPQALENGKPGGRLRPGGAVGREK